MGNTISFSSPALEGAVEISDGTEVFETSYAFDPSNSNAFGIPATVSVAGDPEGGPITPTITVPAKSDGEPQTYTCDPFPPGVTESSILCPGAINRNAGPGTAQITFVSGDTAVPGYLTAGYAFSITTLLTVGGGEGGEPTTVYDTTVTETATATETLPETTITVPGDCTSPSGRPSGTASSSGSRVSSRPSGTRPSQGTGISSRPSATEPSSGTRISPRPTGTRSSGSSGVSSRPSASSGNVHPSGNPPSNSTSTRASASSPTSLIAATGSHGPSGSRIPSGSHGLHNSSLAGATSGSIPTVTKSDISTTSTSTHIFTTTLTTVITTYVPCSTAVSTHADSTIYASSLTPSVVTKTITSVKTEYTVFCPLTKVPSVTATNKDSDQSPQTTIVLTRTKYTCATQPPPPCPTAAAKQKRAAGYVGPDYTLFGGDPGPTITAGEDSTVTIPTFTSTITETSTEYETTSTVTEGCSTTPTRPYASDSPDDGSRRIPVKFRKVKM